VGVAGRNGPLRRGVEDAKRLQRGRRLPPDQMLAYCKFGLLSGVTATAAVEVGAFPLVIMDQGV
jgi:hypothetical protein